MKKRIPKQVTWEQVLDQHFKWFTNACWKVFSAYCDKMLEEGHENKIDKYKWRDYVIYDMQRRHDEEEANSIQNKTRTRRVSRPLLHVHKK